MSTKNVEGDVGDQEIDRRRDALLLGLLKTSPQPRPKRERPKLRKASGPKQRKPKGEKP